MNSKANSQIVRVILSHPFKLEVDFNCLKVSIVVLFNMLTTHLCTVSGVVGMGAELDAGSVNNVSQTEEKIISVSGQISAGRQHPLIGKVNEILCLLGFNTSRLVIKSANSLAVVFICLTLSELVSLRDQWRTGQMKEVVQKLLLYSQIPVN